MKSNVCHGFLYETEEELQALMGIDEYLDIKFDKGNGDWEQQWGNTTTPYDFQSSLAMNVYLKRKAEGLTQRELARKLGIGQETLSKIENGHDNLQAKVKMKIDDYLNED